MTLILTDDEVRQVLAMDLCISAMETAFRALAEGEAINRPRAHTFIPRREGSGHYYLFKSMEGGVIPLGVFALRVTSEHIHEHVRDGTLRRETLPEAPGGRYQALVLLFDLTTCELLAIMPDGFIQTMRVGATSGVAAKVLARPESRVVGLLGTGHQAGPQLQALHSVRRLQRVQVYSPTREHRESFAARMRGELGIPVVAVDRSEDAVRGADIVACCTNSLQPVLSGDWLEPGMHINSVSGAEIDDRTLERADVVVVRSSASAPTNYYLGDEPPLEAAQTEESTKVPLEKVVDLGQVLLNPALGRRSAQQITFFGNIGGPSAAGLGIQFAAAGKAVMERARAQGLGRELPTEWFLQSIHP